MKITLQANETSYGEVVGIIDTVTVDISATDGESVKKLLKLLKETNDFSVYVNEEIVLELEEVKTDTIKDTVTFKVAKQTKRGFKRFKASNGIVIHSILMPFWSQAYNPTDSPCLFVRGTYVKNDDDEMTVTTKDWSLIQQAVAEFNAYYNTK